jgi:hypothetical protein
MQTHTTPNQKIRERKCEMVRNELTLKGNKIYNIMEFLKENI